MNLHDYSYFLSVELEIPLSYTDFIISIEAIYLTDNIGNMQSSQLKDAPKNSLPSN